MDRVLKFGGTSLGTSEALRRSAVIVADAVRAGRKVAVVVSALANERGRATDELFDGHYSWVVGEYHALTNALGVPPLAAISDELMRAAGVSYLPEILSFGERMMAELFAAYLCTIGVEAKSVDAREFIVVDKNGDVCFDKTHQKIVDYFQLRGCVPVVTGFIARDADGNTATLGRGGSDLTAMLLARGVAASAVELWTDVPGIMTADPRVVAAARSISAMSYDEALAAVRAGAKGIPPEAILFAKHHGITVSVKNTRDVDACGTYIGSASPFETRGPKLIASSDQLVIVTVSSDAFVGVAGIMSRMTHALAECNVNLVAFAQAVPEHSISFLVATIDAPHARATLRELFTDSVVEVSELTPCTTLTVVGESMRGTVGTSGRLYGALGVAGANVLFAAQAQENAISLAVSLADGAKALRAAHAEFFEHDGSPAVFLLGVGTIGGAVLAQLGAMSLPKGAHLCGVANSKKMVVDPQGIVPSRAVELLQKSEDVFTLDEFVARAKRVPASQRIVIDCTPSAEIARAYPELFGAGFDIVAANKCANVAPDAAYREMCAAQRSSGRRFLDSANVGGKLGVIPVIRRYAPVITRIEATLSGTIEWLLRHYDGRKPFIELLEEARKLGLTEPDPQLDLSGEDVARKLLILFRVLGVPREFGDNRPFVEDLRGKDESYFRGCFSWADDCSEELYYVAHLTPDGHVGASIRQVGLSSPFFGAKDVENTIVLYTRTGSPIVLRGPGAGPAATAEAVLLDIIELLNQ